MKRLFLILTIVVFLFVCISCNKFPATPSTPANFVSKVEMTTNGETKTINLTEGTIVIYTPPVNNNFVLALTNFDAKWGETRKTTPSNSDIMFIIDLISTNKPVRGDKLLPETFSYSDKQEPPLTGSVNLKTFVNGEEATKQWSSLNNKVKRSGEIKLIEINGDKVKGTIDLKYGDEFSLKGDFVANVYFNK